MFPPATSGKLFQRFPIRFSGAKCCSDRPFRSFGQRCGDDRQVRTIRCTWFHAQRPFSPAAYGQLREHHRRDKASRALAEAVKRNTADPILRNYKIEAWNRDNTAVVVNVTDLFVADVEEMSPFSKYGLYTAFES